MAKLLNSSAHVHNKWKNKRLANCEHLSEETWALIITFHPNKSLVTNSMNQREMSDSHDLS